MPRMRNVPDAEFGVRIVRNANCGRGERVIMNARSLMPSDQPRRPPLHKPTTMNQP